MSIKGTLCYNTDAAKSAKEHNNANVIAIAADEINLETAVNVINVWLESKFLGGRYQERIDLIQKYEVKER